MLISPARPSRALTMSLAVEVAGGPYCPMVRGNRVS